MTRLEVQRFIDEEVKGLYPQWEATDAELRVWMSRLAPFEHEQARAAIQACFSEQGANYHRPVLGKFLERAWSLSRRVRSPEAPSGDLTTNVFVECFTPPADKPHLAGARKPVYVTPASKQSDTEYVQECAESMRLKFAPLYGGHWITRVTTPTVDDGLRGAPARARAYEQILANPDTPGYRFLLHLLMRRDDSSQGRTPVRYASEGQSPSCRERFDCPDNLPTRIGELIPEPGRIPHDPADRARDADRHKWLCADDLLPACEDL